MKRMKNTRTLLPLRRTKSAKSVTLQTDKQLRIMNKKIFFSIASVALITVILSMLRSYQTVQKTGCLHRWVTHLSYRRIATMTEV